jgi:hypothetical protein
VKSYKTENICIPPIVFLQGENKPHNAETEESEKQDFQREVFDKLSEAECEAASNATRLSDAEVFDELLRELETMPGDGSE